MNSVALCNYEEKFDLVWIDGAHGYPVVAMDIINSYRLLNYGGHILIDDIWTSARTSDKFYKSVGGFEALGALKDADLIDDFSIVNKRLGIDYNMPNLKKYVGYFKKNSE